MDCKFCGTSIQEGMRFCPFCGREIPAQQWDGGQASGINWGDQDGDQASGINWGDQEAGQASGINWGGQEAGQASGINWGDQDGDQASGINWGGQEAGQASGINWGNIDGGQAETGRAEESYGTVGGMGGSQAWESEMEEIEIPAKESSYNFARVREKYRENGGVITEEMISLTGKDLIAAAAMAGLAILFLVFGGGITPNGILNALKVVLVLYVPVTAAVCWSEGKGIQALFGFDKDGERIVQTILNMTEEEVRMRESRRRRDLVYNYALCLLSFLLIRGDYYEGNSWGEFAVYLIIVVIAASILALPLLYIRHRATKRLEMFLGLKNEMKKMNRKENQ